MLTRTQLLHGRTSRQTMPSLKQQYEEYKLQRIETYKNSLSRDELLQLGDRAAEELHSGEVRQFVLTEVLMLETVDDSITKRLGVPSYNKWRKQFATRRAAQREPVHWGIRPTSPLVHLLPRIEPDDQILVIGGGVQAEVCLLAAYDTTVMFVDEDIAAVDQLEARLATESLSSRFHAYVAAWGKWLPPVGSTITLVVIDAGTLSKLTYARRHALLTQARELTEPGGVHVILPGDGGATPEAYVSHYPDWDREWLPTGGPGPGQARPTGVVLGCPEKDDDLPSEEIPLARSNG